MNAKKSRERLSWEQLSTLYDQVAEMDPTDRENFLNEHCGDETLRKDLECLLNVRTQSDNFFNSLAENVVSPAYDELLDLFPETVNVGSYRIIKEIGRGGMGTVYLAERNDESYENRVAIKILRRGLDSDDILTRFRLERQILARLNHPNITHLLDGGLTGDGRPYFVMEVVEGKPITSYCNEHQLNVTGRIRLFLQICDALEYAHQNLVIHRDLKPENILVTEDGQIKLLDFGIAKLLDDKTSNYRTLAGTEHRLMTPRFASPEQVKNHSITTASDVYQLGLVLYCLLGGVFPFSFKNCSQQEIERFILEEEPKKLSQKISELKEETIVSISRNCGTAPCHLKTVLKGDLDAIVQKALQKEPNERYRSVQELRDDLLRNLNGQPVIARSATVSYRIRKFVRRHRTGTAVSAIFLCMLAGFITVLVRQQSATIQQRDKAITEARKAEQLSGFILQLFEANDPDVAHGKTLTAQQLLERGEERIESLKNQPEIQAQMLDVTGNIYNKIGEFERSRTLLEKSLKIRRNLYGMNHPETAMSLFHLGVLYSHRGAYSQADSLLQLVLEIQEDQLVPNDLQLAATLSELAYVVRKKGAYDEAEKLYKQSMQIREEKLGIDHPLTLESMSSLGVTFHNKGNYEATEKIFREVLARRRELLEPTHPDLVMSINNLGALLMNKGRFSEAEQLFRETLTIYRELFGEHHPKIALSLNNLGITLRNQGRYSDAEGCFREALAMRERLFGPQNINTAISKFTLARNMLETRQYHSALVLYQQAFEIFREKLPVNHSFTARSLLAVGNVYLAMDNFSKAEKYMDEGFNKIRKIHPDSSLEKALADWDYARLLIEKNDHKQAVNFLNRAHHTLQKIEGPSSIRQDKIQSLLDTLPIEGQISSL